MRQIALPKGFKPILGQSWKPKKVGETLQGILRNVRTVHIPKKGREPAREANIYVIHTIDGADVDVWESAALRSLARVKKGTPVYLRYLGPRKIPGGRGAPMRDFLVATK